MFHERIRTARIVARHGAKRLVDPATTCKPFAMNKTPRAHTPTEVHCVPDEADAEPGGELSPAERRFLDFLIEGAIAEFVERVRSRPHVATDAADPEGRPLDERAGRSLPRRRVRTPRPG